MLVVYLIVDMIHRRTLMQLRGNFRCYASSSIAATKVANTAMEAVKDIPDNGTLSVGGFGVCGKQYFYIISYLIE